MEKRVRAIAFYLPQFHPIPENDEWWGEGFTEWTNVRKAKPLFAGHKQPNFPGELGFYDLRDPMIRDKQALLAREYGIEGFCYWHYWFGNGRRILEKITDEVINSGKPDFPFCLAWANESWTGIWHGLKNNVLIEQLYPGAEDYTNHFQLLLKAFKDNRYILVNGKPLFVVYRPQDIPDITLFVNVFREEAKRNGLPGLYLVANNAPNEWNPVENGFDAVARTYLHKVVPILTRVKNKFTRTVLKREPEGPFIFDYRKSIRKMLPENNVSYKNYPCIIPNWDNSPRSGKRGWILKNATPELFGKLLKEAINRVLKYPKEEQIVFIKSWNEWAEGNYLEPDLVHGRKYLEVCKKVIEQTAEAD